MIVGLVRALRVALLCGLLSVFQTAGATPFSTNFSDMWWNPAESGWGVNLNQQDDTMFATFFVYSLDSKAHWYIATLIYKSATGDGSVIFDGDLYETTGPYFGFPFDPAQVTLNKVGTASFKSAGSSHATLQYSVGNVPVTKQIQRQTVGVNRIAGSYLGGTSDITFDCNPASRNGILTEDGGPIAITQNANLVSIKTPTCTFNGTYTQNGQIGTIVTSYNCNSGGVGTATFNDVYVETSGIIGNYVGKDDTCSFRGTIGGARRQ